MDRVIGESRGGTIENASSPEELPDNERCDGSTGGASALLTKRLASPAVQVV